MITIPLIIVLLLLLLWRLRIKKLKSYDSKISGRIEILEKYNGEKALRIKNYTQGVSTEHASIRKSYWYYVALQAVLHCQNKTKPAVLFLGLGANTSSSLVGKMNTAIHQTIVEIDPVIIKVCMEFFGLDALKNCTLIQGDAYKLIDTRKDFYKKFDVIVVDIFTGISPYVSMGTNKPTFVQKVLLWLKPDGMLIFNRPADKDANRKDTRLLKDYLQTLLKNVTLTFIKDPRGYYNDVITAAVKRRR